MQPQPPSDPCPPVPDAKSEWQEKIYLDELVGPKCYGSHVIGALIGIAGTNRKRMEMESGCRVFFRGLGTEREGNQPVKHYDESELYAPCLNT